MKPYDYQQEVIDGATKLWRAGLRRIAAVLATGAGKTVIFSIIARTCRAAGLPVLVIAHRRELIYQALDKLRQVDPEARLGRMQGTTKEYNGEIVVGSIQTCATPGSLALLKSRRWGLIIIDETHHVAASTYMRLLRELGAFEADGPLVLGVTATLDRADGLALGDVFEEIVTPQVELPELIERGFLVRPRGIRVKIADLDLRGVRRTAGDLNAGQLGAAMSASMAPQRIVEAWQEHAKGRPTVAFLPTKAVSREQAQAFRDAGFTAVHVDDESSDDDRAAAIADSRAGKLDVLCNVNLFGEGTDMPWISAVVLRMTSSRVVYTQQVGRGLRLHPGKKDCVILDPAGVTGRHRLQGRASLDGAPPAADTPEDLIMYEEDLDEPLVDRDESDDEGVTPTEYVDGRLAHEMVDLFGQSHSAWLRTPGGCWFLPCGSAGFLFLRPAASGTLDRYDLRYTTFDRGHQGAVREDMEIGYAMAAGDEFVAERPMWQAERAAPWRSLPAGRGRTRGELHDEKMIVQAAAMFDARPLDEFLPAR